VGHTSGAMVGLADSISLIHVGSMQAKSGADISLQDSQWTRWLLLGGSPYLPVGSCADDRSANIGWV
jgi:hypothetical protein